MTERLQARFSLDDNAIIVKKEYINGIEDEKHRDRNPAITREREDVGEISTRPAKHETSSPPPKRRAHDHVASQISPRTRSHTTHSDEEIFKASAKEHKHKT